MAPTMSTSLALVVMALLTLCLLAPVAEGDTPVSCNADPSTPSDSGFSCPLLTASFILDDFWWNNNEEVDAYCAEGNSITSGACAYTAENVFRCCNDFTLTFTSPTSVVITYGNAITVSNVRSTSTHGSSCSINGAVPSPFEMTIPEDDYFNGIEVCYSRYTTKGSVSGDPKVVGGDGVTFYFHGRMNQDFCLVSDSDLHINAHFIGKRPEGRSRDFTWVQALGFVYGSHTLTVAVKRVAQWDDTVDHLEISYNGDALALNPKSSWASRGAVMTLTRRDATNAVDLEIKEKMGVSLNAVPIGKHESDVHHYGITGEDCFAHLDMQFRFYNLSTAVNGVLGQTYQPGFVNPVKRGVAMPVMGGGERFESSSLLATDCAVGQYTATALARGSAMPSFEAACGSSGLPNGVPGGITCRRRSFRS